MERTLFTIGILFLANFCHSQEINSRFHIDAGYGLAGSFFVRTVTEMPPFEAPGYREFSRKKFVGNAQNISIGYRLNERYLLKGGIHYQHFTRRVQVNQMLGPVSLTIDKSIHHRDYMYYGGINRLYLKKKAVLSGGLGLYFLASKMENIQFGSGNPSFYNNYETTLNNSPKNLEMGAFSEFSYEYKFQTKVNLGVKAQFYFTVSAMYAESVALLPFIKINF
ncbi:hypothetical protein [Paracnuella aquatica]|uniref:hypothetical protein n=1 Tax=Paracnuella aquatica TaxID=2268757 RepID=UPI000DEF2430|nr:hypothetical protein [Paracnuella aquatica]RPD44213.1 hypothetical protein DRJ53_17665 [Paracnuella aquatica]